MKLRIGLAAAALTLSAGILSATVAVPIPVLSTYTFSGTCTDCKNADGTPGTGVGTLTLQNYHDGDSIGRANFVSFAYSSPWLNYTSGPRPRISGAVSSAPGAYNFGFRGLVTGSYTSLFPDGASSFSAEPFFFDSDGLGGWETGFEDRRDDFGVNGLWNAPSASAVPEPAFAGAICGIVACLAGLRRYRRRAA